MTTINDVYINALLADASYVDNFVVGMTGARLADILTRRMTPDLVSSGKLSNPDGDPQRYAVTGYSLGGHLATAFNLLHGGDTIYGGAARIKEVVTFNGAGVGQVTTGTLGDALSYFNSLRSTPGQIETALFTTPELALLYEQIKTRLTFTATTTTAQAKALTEVAIAEVIGLQTDPIAYATSGIDPLAGEKAPLLQALKDMLDMQKEALRIAGLKAGGSDADKDSSPLTVLPGSILAEQLDYRLAVGLAATRTRSATTLGGAMQAVTGKSYGSPMLANQFDLVGTETTTTPMSAVANSQWHYGANVPVFIEDQPLYRGDMLPGLALGSFDNPKLLVDQYAQNNFADTHSLVLLVDSLSVQNVLLRLVVGATQATIAQFVGRSQISRRWRHGESTPVAVNQNLWRSAA